jgi:phage N-6-adenine-methyltransferase
MGRKLSGKYPKPATLRQRRYRAKLKRIARGIVADSDTWGTPDTFLELVRAVMGGIDCDPASNASAQTRVRAAVYYTEADNGLTKPWLGRLFLNPPYGNVPPFVEKLITDLAAGRVTEAIVLVNAATSTAWFRRLLSVTDAHCFPRSRVSFVGPDGLPRNGTAHDQIVFYRGPAPERFNEVFAPVGSVIHTRMAMAA